MFTRLIEEAIIGYWTPILKSKQSDSYKDIALLDSFKLTP